jgi:cytidylate kinase
MSDKLQIAIDGVVAAGKDTAAYFLAKKLNLDFIETGSLYRAASWEVAHLNAPIDDEQAVCDIIKQTTFDIVPATVEDGRKYTVLVDGQDVTLELRTKQMDMGASIIGIQPQSRTLMIAAQVEMAKHHPRVVMTGRGIGRMVIPRADLKVYLIARPEVRAARRLIDKQKNNPSITYEQVFAEIVERDRINRERSFDPDTPTEDAIIIDTSDMTIEEMVDEIAKYL